MRRALIEKMVKFAVENPPKVDAVLLDNDLYFPFETNLSPEEENEFERRLMEESNKLTEWPEPTIM